MNGKRIQVKETASGWTILRNGKLWRIRNRASGVPMSTDPANIVRKLIVELNQRTDDDLTRAAEAGQMTKTTVVNRAVQVYERVRASQAAGGHLVLVKADGSTENLLFT